MIRRRLSHTVLWLVSGLTLAAVVAFFFTHTLWYDALKISQKIEFFTEALVAYGTLALAVTTWASVAETQQVLADEDLRFRRNRMPVLKISTARQDTDKYNSNPGYVIVIHNIGNGPARNIRLWFGAAVTMRWNKEHLADNRTESDTKTFEVDDFYAASYLKQDTDITIDLEKQGAQLAAMNVEFDNVVSRAVLKYEDLFGAEYLTSYVINESMPFNLEKFKWVAPTTLLLK